MPHTHEVENKYARVDDYLAQHDLGGLLLERHENIAWASGGQVEVRVANAYETGVAALLFTRSGRRYYVAPVNEGPRLADEEFTGLGYEPVLYPWQTGSLHASVAKIVTSGPVACDTPGGAPGYRAVDAASLRGTLLPEELERLTSLGSAAAEVIAFVLHTLEPGLTEDEITARLASPLLEQGIFPSVLLIGTDDRIRKYKHAVPRKGKLERYGMLNLCARRWGLVVSITRFVHFGKPPAELVENFQKAARIHAEILNASTPGATAGAIYDVAAQAYAQAGFPDEINLHHQGGTAGYGERIWLIRPGGEEQVASPEVFAYNPSLQGAKAEDTVILETADGQLNYRNVTATPSLPAIDIEIGGKTFRSAGLLLH